MFRFALPPSQDLDIEDLRIALFDYLLSRQKKEKLTILIKNANENAEDKIQENLELLSLFGTRWDEIVYQSHNLKFYQQLASKLLIDKNAFCCFCTQEDKKSCQCEYLSDEEVLNREDSFCIKTKKPKFKINLHDEIKGNLEFDESEIENFMLLQQNKLASNNFATAVDDMLLDTSMVICEEKELLNSFIQKCIHKYLAYDKQIKYAHLASIANEQNKISIKSLLDDGYLPSAISNYLILLGNKTPKEIFGLDEAVEWFDIKDISKTAPKFDLKKLNQINKEHIKMLDSLKLSSLIGYSSSDIGELAKIYLKEADTINQIKTKIDTIFSKKDSDEFGRLKELAKSAPYFEEFDDFKRYLIQKSGLEEKRVLKELGFLITGSTKTQNLNEIYPHIKNYLGEILK